VKSQLLDDQGSQADHHGTGDAHQDGLNALKQPSDVEELFDHEEAMHLDHDPDDVPGYPSGKGRLAEYPSEVA